MVTRITGFSSGLDIDSIVKKLMTAEKAPLDKMNQQQQTLQWKRESYRESSTKMVSFLQNKLDTLSRTASINAQSATVTGNTDALTAKAASSASGGVMDITVNKLATASSATSSGWTSTASSTSLSTLFGGTAPSSVTIGAASITIDAGETIDSFINKINNNTKTGVTAIYDEASGLSLTNKATGAQAMNVSSDVSTAFKLTSNPGVNAELTVNGLSMTKTSNNFSINGVEISLKKAGGASTHIEVVKDVDALVANVQSFVDAYNDVLSTYNNKLSEERYSKYAPLTTEQRSGMSDEEAKLWTDKAKSGMLKNDSILQETVSSMRNAMVQGVDVGNKDAQGNPLPMTMSDLGITTGGYETKGKLILDADKLRAAIDKDPDVVSKFFGTRDASTQLTNNYTQQDGIIAKLKKVGNVSLQRMAETAGTSRVSSDLTSTFIANSTIGEQLNSLDRRVSDMTARLNRLETNYYKKFTAMETAINKYNSTSSSLAGM
ncbi:flagellar filament capping protein FliD [Paenibacillus wulumuqiensis]|uniref:flagellar filament capping protein FliD n=1 Tax=Paenibacillus wulumuqiensis TaxID=1567107 RepID=UPI000619F6FD|nr:flagellar filament capping protein FliD [Paenibacillus wulumuqiensis]